MKTGIIVGAILLIVFFALRAPDIQLKETGKLVAYRAGGQMIDYAKVGNHGCAARNLFASANPQIENTLEAIDLALANGFDVIHLNIHRTADNHFAVFHDWNLECATNGTGETSSHRLGYLQSLDAGYGYTTDAGTTFPWRDSDLKIPSLHEVFTLYPQTRLWLNLKTSDADSIDLLAKKVQELPPAYQKTIVFFADDNAILLYRTHLPETTALSVESTKTCLKDYILYGWTRFYPASCKNTRILIPPSKAHYLWGWPEKFAALAQAHGSHVYLWTEHTPFIPEYDLRRFGVGVITGDTNYFSSQSKK